MHIKNESIKRTALQDDAFALSLQGGFAASRRGQVFPSAVRFAGFVRIKKIRIKGKTILLLPLKSFLK